MDTGVLAGRGRKETVHLRCLRDSTKRKSTKETVLKRQIDKSRRKTVKVDNSTN